MKLYNALFQISVFAGKRSFYFCEAPTYEKHTAGSSFYPVLTDSQSFKPQSYHDNGGSPFSCVRAKPHRLTTVSGLTEQYECVFACLVRER